MKAIPDEKFPDPHHGIYSRTVFGFWIYLLTDFILFATLFAAYAVLRKALFGGTPPHLLFELPYTLIQTLILLISSYTVGIASVFAHRREKKMTLFFFSLTFLLGLAFMGMELNEFARFMASGNGWQRSAYLSAYFTLVGTHGFHMIFALLWILVLCLPLVKQDINQIHIRRLTCLRMFWQFLNIIWVFIFTIVYLMGEIA